jgi:glucose-1-phosphate thymidylyltransferase
VAKVTSDPVGVIPAAGLGTRLLPLAYPKELLPITYTDADGQIVPRPVLQASLDQMRRAGIRQCVIVIAEWKLELVRVFGDGSALGMSLAYVVRGVPRGLSDALDAATPWVGDHDVCIALPDTLISPDDALARVKAEREASGADVVLGVFPTDHPEQLGPVRVASGGAVIEVLDKPASTDLRNTWGMAIWSPHFTAFLAREVAAAPEDKKPVLGALFQRALEVGLSVRAVEFPDGHFVDVGTSQGLAEALQTGAIRR